MNNTSLSQKMLADSQEFLRIAREDFMPLTDSQLNHKAHPESWSMLECLEHLNRYSRYYNAKIKSGLAKGKSGSELPFRSSFLGKKFTASVDPKNLKKSKTLSRYNPAKSQLGRKTLEEFIRHQEELQALASKAAQQDLNPKTVPVEFFKLIRMKTGDAILFTLAHQMRHIQQAQRLLP